MDEARAWLRQHDLDEAHATPVLAARLAARRSAKLGHSLILAGLLLAAAFVQVYLMVEVESPAPVALLAAAVGGLVVTQFLLDRWVRGVDQRMGATLSRRATHPVQPGWRAVLGRPHAALALAAFLGAAALAVSALAVSDEAERYPALVLLTGVCGVGAVAAIQFRHLLARPVVADGAASLTADVIMRIDDARDTSVPSVLMTLPVVILFGTAPTWWGVTAMVFLIGGSISLVLVQLKAPGSGAMARRVVSVQ
jgi:hypothetical protein